ncbi:MAG: high-affinity iron transporter [Candidatus Peribacter sp.]|jgi:high-affinity iron transporter|nr:high-affinity iron transporter [Candidatus Peribacter sp.]MBT4392702.1 high-affinity iron transporter [Candidatus Peribacter sp.]MBT4600681.1 high-affinity iron transporter [Candidatus Peribacter sp.]MBT5148650.1 high-affinity iron transporter [Candidatus Peribacter sp.]MBT5637755.1 high-affinity iron transporter [Candidatus Peribacter sp.]
MAALLITLRETLEASLIVGIMLAFLSRTQNRDRNPIIWAGVAAGILTSVIAGFIIMQFAGGFEGRSEKIYEGVTMLVAGGLITWMIIWLALNGKYMKEGIEKKMHLHLETGALISLFLLVYTSILREGIETVIFLQAAFMQSEDATTHLGAIAGMVLAVGAAWLLFRGMMTWFSLSRFFQFTGVLLMFFAAGLIAHGVHELQEAYLIPIFIEHVWDVNHLINEKGTFGGLLKGVFGYNGNPSLIEVLSYILYLSGVGFLWKRMRGKSF